MFAAHYLIYTLFVALIIVPIAIYFIKGAIRPAARGGLAIVGFPFLVLFWGFDRARSFYLRALPLGILDYFGVLAVITVNLLIITWGVFGTEGRIWNGMLLLIPLDLVLLIVHSGLRRGNKQL